MLEHRITSSAQVESSRVNAQSAPALNTVGQYNRVMARGWESKSVEDQITEKENASIINSNLKLNRAQNAIRQKRESLILARAHTLSNLESASDARYRDLLERTLAHLESQIANLGS